MEILYISIFLSQFINNFKIKIIIGKQKIFESINHLFIFTVLLGQPRATRALFLINILKLIIFCQKRTALIVMYMSIYRNVGVTDNCTNCRVNIYLQVCRCDCQHTPVNYVLTRPSVYSFALCLCSSND